VPDLRTEHVLVVPTERFHAIGHFQGFSTDIDRYVDGLLDPAHTSYQPRDRAEQNPDFKQLIPYCIFRYANPDSEEQLFQYTRGKGQGEGRLHAKRSIGIGGHISSDDARGEGVDNPYEEGLRRELDEELCINTPYCRRCVGLINDDQTEVGRVHLGIVYLLDVGQPAVEPREVDILNAGFCPVSQLVADLRSFETWSQICLKALFGPSEI